MSVGFLYTTKSTLKVILVHLISQSVMIKSYICFILKKPLLLKYFFIDKIVAKQYKLNIYNLYNILLFLS